MIVNTFQPQEYLLTRPLLPPSAREIVLRRLEDPSGTRAIQRLRQEIDLAVHTRLNPYFHAEEKKETK
jgi:hypothetical protein